MNKELKLPFYAKAVLLLIGLYVFVSMLSQAQGIILPFIYAIIIAIAISPLVNLLVRKKVNRTLAIAIVLVLVLLVLITIVFLIVSQASLLREALPRLIGKFQLLLNQCVGWASENFNISTDKINDWIEETKNGLISDSKASIGITLTTVGDVLATAFLSPVYIFMLLYYQSHLVSFIHKLFGADNNKRVNEFLTVTKSIIQSYLVGLSIEFLIVATMNSIGLMALGIDYAILFGILGAALNIIPYLGGIVAVSLFMVIALVTKSPEYMLYVFLFYAFVQLFDNNYIVPRIIGSKVKLNALISLLAVIGGAALWGIPGMFLSIPIMAVIKLIFDRIEPLKTCGFLLGETKVLVPKKLPIPAMFLKKK